jgi:ubiquinone/menaquinone biosynthesis C-methylase UbiE
VVGIDLSPAMLARATHRAHLSPAPIELKQMDGTRLDFLDATFDAAVATFLFCVLPDELQLLALRELGRVVKPGGLIRLLEYVRPQGTIRRIVAKIWEPWIGWAYGASFDRRTEERIPAAGLQIQESRFVVPDLMKFISIRVGGN